MGHKFLFAFVEIIAAGKDVGADQALKIGLVDGVVKAEKLVEGAI